MSSRKRGSIVGTLAFRLTLWYAGLLILMTSLGFTVIYLHLSRELDRQIDTMLHDDAVEFDALYRQSGMTALQREFDREAASDGTTGVFFRLLAPDDTIVATSDLSAWRGLPAHPERPVAATSTTTIALPNRKHKIRILSQTFASNHLFQTGRTLKMNDAIMGGLLGTFIGVLAALLFGGGILGWFMGRRAMGGVERITRTAALIGKGDIAHRVPLGREGREITELAHAFNDMLERIQALIDEMGEVTDNIAHDLRSPITRMRGIAETSLTVDNDADAYREMAGSVVEECDRLVALINTMLEIARTSSGIAALAMEEVKLDRIAREAREIFLPVAQAKGISLDVAAEDADSTVRGDRARLQRTVANLIDNAIKYTPKGGSVSIIVRSSASSVVIEVKDSGVGIAPDELRRIFNRFYRGEKSRSTPGSGLGLSLARAIARAHGGDINVKSTLGAGSTFSLTVPCS